MKKILYTLLLFVCSYRIVWYDKLGRNEGTCMFDSAAKAEQTAKQVQKETGTRNKYKIKQCYCD